MLDVLYRDLLSFGIKVGFCNFKIIAIFMLSVYLNFFLNFLLLVANTNFAMQGGTRGHWIILKVGSAKDEM